MDQFTILNLYDGRYYDECRVYDQMSILVRGYLSPVFISNFDSYMNTSWHKNRGRFDQQKFAVDYLKEHGIEVLPVLVAKINYSGE